MRRSTFAERGSRRCVAVSAEGDRIGGQNRGCAHEGAGRACGVTGHEQRPAARAGGQGIGA